ncbi:arsenate reductase/protein-tyrosine-phosphatase family protein [Actibacterium lipolyticum]|uniref:Arsenate-mycothiol transferase ArsC2 n=1 Tax=Actibacterium lipolyticum TaxID=1524263 RepID=A0A238JV59_9RHOB|nr:helix-turn-helix domain-containing protein [Actibacterium lipolyticum]SMX34531.1 Arsenate-mycothiol transferase ArsC2 [Actibacterium lipolyticum]
MELYSASQILTTLGHEGRLSVFRLLARRAPDGVRPSEIAAALTMKPNTLSVYLSALERAGLVSSERQGKSVFYFAQVAQMGALVDFLVADCCRGRPDLCAPKAAAVLGDVAPALGPVYNVLFICTGNSARSIFAEAILRAEGAGRFNVYSAGVKPYSELNSFAVEVLERLGHDVSGLRSKNIAEFQADGSPKMDFVFTVCDGAANEECPPWPGQPITAHWGLPDPVKAVGTDAEKAYAFANTYSQMLRRVQAFVALPIAQLDKISLQSKLDDIGQFKDTNPE